MKKELSLIPTIIAIIACVLLVFNSIKISGLQKELNRLRSDMDDEIRFMNQNISDIYGDVQAMLEEKVNQLAVSEWKYGDINIDARTAEVICTVVPKVHAPGTTQATIVCNGQEHALSYAGDRYTTTIELPLFDRNELNMVMLDDNGTIRMQELDWVIEPRYEALLLSHAGMGGSATGKVGDSEYIWSPEYAVVIDVQSKAEFQIKSAELVEILDGQETDRIPIDLSADGQDAYLEALRKTGEPVPEAVSRVGYTSGSSSADSASFIYCLDKDYRIPNGSMLEFYVDIVDGNGLRYRSFAECMAVTAAGEPDAMRMEEKQMYAFAEAVVIFDEEGNVVYEIAPELFQ